MSPTAQVIAAMTAVTTGCLFLHSVTPALLTAPLFAVYFVLQRIRPTA